MANSWEHRYQEPIRTIRFQMREQRFIDLDHPIRLYPPLNRQYRVIKDFAEQVIWRL